jgi:hypothetical protein
MAEWVKCSDRLPDIGDDVLIMIPVCGSFNIEGGKYKGLGQFYGAWCSTHGVDRAYKVSHWMPMPEPPK